MIRDLLFTKSKASHIFVVFLLDFSPPLSPRPLGHPAFSSSHISRWSFWGRVALTLLNPYFWSLGFCSSSSVFNLHLLFEWFPLNSDLIQKLQIHILLCLLSVFTWLYCIYHHPRLPYPKCSSSHILKLDRTRGAIDSQHPCIVSQPSPVDSSSLSSLLSIFIPLDLHQPLLYLQEYRSRLALRLGTIT